MSRAPQAAKPESSRVTRLLSVGRKLIDYGRQLVSAFRCHGGNWARLVIDIIRDRRRGSSALNGQSDAAWTVPLEPSPAPAGTGPP
jgi:hypothetical protein